MQCISQSYNSSTSHSLQQRNHLWPAICEAGHSTDKTCLGCAPFHSTQAAPYSYATACSFSHPPKPKLYYSFHLLQYTTKPLYPFHWFLLLHKRSASKRCQQPRFCIGKGAKLRFWHMRDRFAMSETRNTEAPCPARGQYFKAVFHKKHTSDLEMRQHCLAQHRDSTALDSEISCPFSSNEDMTVLRILQGTLTI